MLEKPEPPRGPETQSRDGGVFLGAMNLSGNPSVSLSLAAWLLSYEFWAVLQALRLAGRDCEPLRLVRELRQSHLPHVQASAQH